MPDYKAIKPISIELASPARHRTTRVIRIHGWAIAVFVRCLMLFGYVVVLVGRCRSGKSLILERATPGKVLNKMEERIHTGIAPTLCQAELPSGQFSIDGAAQFEPSSLLEAVESLCGRAFAISVQRTCDLTGTGLDKVQALGGRRRVILALK